MITPDGSKVIVTKTVTGQADTTASVLEYSTRTGQVVATVAPPLTSLTPGPLCQELWTDPSGEQVMAWCQHGEKYDQGHVSPVTLYLHMNGTDILAFAW